MEQAEAHANIQAWIMEQEWDLGVPVPSVIERTSGIVVSYGFIGCRGTLVYMYMGTHVRYGDALAVHVHETADEAVRCTKDTAIDALNSAGLAAEMAASPVPDTVPQGWSI